MFLVQHLFCCAVLSIRRQQQQMMSTNLSLSLSGQVWDFQARMPRCLTLWQHQLQQQQEQLQLPHKPKSVQHASHQIWQMPVATFKRATTPTKMAIKVEPCRRRLWLKLWLLIADWVRDCVMWHEYRFVAWSGYVALLCIARQAFQAWRRSIVATKWVMPGIRQTTKGKHLWDFPAESVGGCSTLHVECATLVPSKHLLEVKDTLRSDRWLESYQKVKELNAMSCNWIIITIEKWDLYSDL